MLLLWKVFAYKYDSDDGKNHNRLARLLRSNRLIATDSGLQHICLLLLKLKKVFELGHDVLASGKSTQVDCAYVIISLRGLILHPFNMSAVLLTLLFEIEAR